MLMELKGVNGQIELYDGKIVIKRKGALAKMTQGFTKGDKTIYINQISGIQFKTGGNFVNGYIQFSLPGGNERTKGAFDATQDENSVMFRKSDNELATELKRRIEKMLHTDNNHVTSSSSADEIKKFKELYDSGIITEDEFDQKKKQLLGL